MGAKKPLCFRSFCMLVQFLPCDRRVVVRQEGNLAWVDWMKQGGECNGDWSGHKQGGGVMVVEKGLHLSRQAARTEQGCSLKPNCTAFSFGRRVGVVALSFLIVPSLECPQRYVRFTPLPPPELHAFHRAASLLPSAVLGDDGGRGPRCLEACCARGQRECSWAWRRSNKKLWRQS